MSKERETGKRSILSWRLSPKLKEKLEAAARDEKVSVDAVLTRIVRAWLATRQGAGDASDLTRGHSTLTERAGFREEADAYLAGTDDASTRRASARENRPQRKDADDAEQQRQLREQLLRAAGTVSIGLGPYTNQRVREVMGEALEKKYRESQRRAPRRSR